MAPKSHILVASSQAAVSITGCHKLGKSLNCISKWTTTDCHLSQIKAGLQPAIHKSLGPILKAVCCCILESLKWSLPQRWQMRSCWANTNATWLWHCKDTVPGCGSRSEDVASWSACPASSLTQPKYWKAEVCSLTHNSRLHKQSGIPSTAHSLSPLRNTCKQISAKNHTFTQN